MIRKRAVFRRGVFVLALVCFSTPHRIGASVLGSPHDLFRHGYMVVPEEKLRSNPQCDQCHIGLSDDRPLIWQVVPPSLRELGSVGLLCASCHDGISMVDRNVDAGVTVFHPFSHGLNAADAPTGVLPEGTGLPRPVDGLYSCMTCHDAHETTYRPFLRVPFYGLCKRCHNDKKLTGFGVENVNGDHPVDVEPFDENGGPSPIEVGPFFSRPFPLNYPERNGIMATRAHWTSGGHLEYGSFGKVDCSTCHSLHGTEAEGVLPALVAKDPVRAVSDEFCEGCHRGERGDGKEQPPYPNPGGTRTGRTYHPLDDDEANGIGWNIAIADTVQLQGYVWGTVDPDTELPAMLCTTCHRAHGGMENSPCLVRVNDDVREEDPEVTTFCEICHRDPPPGHHGYSNADNADDEASTQFSALNTDDLGHTFGTTEPGVVYCSLCHKAHNAGFNKNEEDFIPILVFSKGELCIICHSLGVSHFLGDPTLPSTYSKVNPSLRREPWPSGGMSSFAGTGLNANTITCDSCHNMDPSSGSGDSYDSRLLAPAGEEVEWEAGHPEQYLCTGCHGEEPATVGQGKTHPLMDSDATLYPIRPSRGTVTGDIPVTYTPNGKVNCHTCHVPHGALIQGGVYILKVVRGTNLDPKAIHPAIDSSILCDSCHPYL